MAFSDPHRYRVDPNPPFGKGRSRVGSGAKAVPSPLVVGNVEVQQVEAKVSALIPEYDQVKVTARNGNEYVLTNHTEGVTLRDLTVGQWLSCVVTRRLPRVLSAELVA